jgi:hypothetical protein
MRWTDLSPTPNIGVRGRVFSLILLAIPTVTLGLLALRTGLLPLAVGAGVQGLFFLVFLRAQPVWRPPVSASVVVLYLIALVWAWVALRGSTDWLGHVAQGVLLLIGVGLLAVHDLTRTGAGPLRRANHLSRRIASRDRWPAQLADCRVIPEAIALRDAIHADPSPALVLLSDPRPQVRTAALGALEYRPHWRAGEAELVLKVGWESEEPAVRAAAAYALAGVETPELVSGLAEFLRDRVPEVRRAAGEALMWDADSRWPFARDAVREALADPALSEEGPLFVGIGRLPAAAVADLIFWSAEHPPLAGRAIHTLIEHYHADLVAAERPELGTELSAMMLAQDTPPSLRVEIAALLREHHLLTADLLDRLTNLDQPAPIRLFAAELMLRINPHDPDGMDVLRGLARQPNRELAVRVGAVLQFVLGMEVGLTDGELPAPNSKQAAEVTRRVLAWANGASQDVLRPTPGPRAGLGSSRAAKVGFGSRAAMPGLPPTPPPLPPRVPVSMMDESAMLPHDESSLLPPEHSSILSGRSSGIHAEAPVEPDEAAEAAEVNEPDRSEEPDEAAESELLRPEESSPHDESSLFSAGESSLFSPGHEPMAPGNSSILSGDSPELPDASGMEMGESSMLPHDEKPPKPPATRRPGSSAVF